MSELNEQSPNVSQAEKLASEILDKISYPKALDGGCLQSEIVQAINQATEELQKQLETVRAERDQAQTLLQEKERQVAALNCEMAHIMNVEPFPTPDEGLETAQKPEKVDKDWWNNQIDVGLTQVQNGNLVTGEDAYARLKAKMEHRKAYELTQATADAYEKRIREDERERVIRECIEAVYEKQANGFPQGGEIESGMLMAFGDAREALQALLPAKLSGANGANEPKDGE